MAAPEGRNTLTNKAIGDLRQMRKSVLGTSGDQGEFGGGAHHQSARWYWAKLTSALASGSLESPTTCTVDAWLPDPAISTDQPPFIVATDSDLTGITIVNRFPFFSGATGDVIKIQHAYGEWTPVTGGGGAGGLFLFKLNSVDCALLTAMGTPVRPPKGGTLPPTDQHIVDGLDEWGVPYSLSGWLSSGDPALLDGQYAWCQEIDPDPYSPGVRLWVIIIMSGLDSICG